MTDRGARISTPTLVPILPGTPDSRRGFASEAEADFVDTCAQTGLPIPWSGAPTRANHGLPAITDTLTECLTHDPSGASHGHAGADPKATFADTVRTRAPNQRKEAGSG